MARLSDDFQLTETFVGLRRRHCPSLLPIAINSLRNQTHELRATVVVQAVAPPPQLWHRDSQGFGH